MNSTSVPGELIVESANDINIPLCSMCLLTIDLDNELLFEGVV